MSTSSTKAVATVGPGRSAALEPVARHALGFRLGRPEATETLGTDGSRGVEETVDLEIRHGRTTSAGARSTASPFPGVVFGDRVPTVAVVVGVPVAAPPRGLPAGPGLAAASGLEDAPGHAARRPVRLRPARPDAARASLAGPPRQRLDAAAVLATLRDPAGAVAFGRACLDARGNERVRLIDILVGLPPSAPSLGTIVELIVGPTRAYLTRVPGAGSGDMERRAGLIRRLRDAYPRADLGKHADRLRAYADALPAGDPTRVDVESLLKTP